MLDETSTPANPNINGTQPVAGEIVPKKAGGGRDEQGRWIRGVSGNPEGARPLTEEEKMARRATKEIIAEYKEKLAESLPQIEPVLVGLAIAGDMQAIKEINDRVIGKPKQPIVGPDEEEGDNPILVKFIDGEPKDNRDPS